MLPFHMNFGSTRTVPALPYILLQKAIKEGTFTVQDSIDFLVAGNGSKTLKFAYMKGNYKWLSDPTNTVYISLYGMISEILAVEKNRISIRYSTRPKEEVANGLVESFKFIRVEKDCCTESEVNFDEEGIANEFIDLYMKYFSYDFKELFTSVDNAKAVISGKIKQINGLAEYEGRNGIEKFALAVREISFKK